MEVFWVGTFMAIIAGILAMTGFILIDNSEYEKLGIVLTVIGILLGLFSNVYVYMNGTEAEIIRWMFWSR